MKTTPAASELDRRSGSLSESRHSIGSTRHQRRRSSEYHRAHHPRIIPGPSIPASRASKYRSATSAQNRASKRLVQHKNSQTSILYSYQPHQ
jgi:hypothetical protein